MKQPDARFAWFVEHPRYGRGPRVTGLNPHPNDEGVHVNWNTSTLREVVDQYEAVIGPWPYGMSLPQRHSKRIPFTAVIADLDRQTSATIPVTHYFDLEKRCCDCQRPYIFFAEEQRHWYEELGFKLDVDCVRCIECRKRQQGLAAARERYESLFHIKDRSIEQNLQMAEDCLSMIECGEFSRRQTERVRMLMNLVPKDAAERAQRRFTTVMSRLQAAEGREVKSGGGEGEARGE